MASPDQCKAEPGNANLSTEAKTEERNSQSAKYTVSDGLFAAYERLAPSHSGRMQRDIAEMHAGFPQQCAAFEDGIRQFAVAKWRSELYYEMEASFLSSAIADELRNPESAAFKDEFGGKTMFGRALRRDAEGLNVFSKLARFESLNRFQPKGRSTTARPARTLGPDSAQRSLSMWFWREI